LTKRDIRDLDGERRTKPTLVDKLVQSLLAIIGITPPVEPHAPESPDDMARAKYAQQLKDWFESNTLLHTENAREARKALDQAILTLSSASLAMAITFVNFMNGPIHHARWIQISWFLFGLAIAITLVSYAVSEALSEKKIDTVRDRYLKAAESQGIKLDDVDVPCRWKFIIVVRECALRIFSSNALDILNVVALASFIVGLLLLSDFCWNNFEHKQRVFMKNKTVAIEKPATTPARPATTPARPATTPARPATTPARPATTPARPSTPAQPAGPPGTVRRDEGFKPSTTTPMPTPPPKLADKKKK
jgi:hypothetical protein